MPQVHAGLHLEAIAARPFPIGRLDGAPEAGGHCDQYACERRIFSVGHPLQGLRVRSTRTRRSGGRPGRTVRFDPLRPVIGVRAEPMDHVHRPRRRGSLTMNETEHLKKRQRISPPESATTLRQRQRRPAPPRDCPASTLSRPRSAASACDAILIAHTHVADAKVVPQTLEEIVARLDPPFVTKRWASASSRRRTAIRQPSPR